MIGLGILVSHRSYYSLQLFIMREYQSACIIITELEPQLKRLATTCVWERIRIFETEDIQVRVCEWEKAGQFETAGQLERTYEWESKFIF